MLEELRKFNLQLFAELAEEDNPEEVADDDGDEEEEEVDLETVLEAIQDTSVIGAGDKKPAKGGNPDIDDEEDSDQDNEDRDDEIPVFDSREEFDQYIEEAISEHSAALEEEIQTRAQTIANQVIGDRVKRDRKANEVKKLEALTGMPLEDLAQSVFNNAVEEKADSLGISIEEAESIVSNEFSVRLNGLYNDMAKQDALAKTQIDKYVRDKSDFLKSNPRLAPLLKKYEQEIDELSGSGQILDYDIAANQILGKKMTNGDLFKTVKDSAQKQASKKKPGATVPSPRRGSGKSQQSFQGSLTREQRQMASLLGVTPREYLNELVKEQKAKRRR